MYALYALYKTIINCSISENCYYPLGKKGEDKNLQNDTKKKKNLHNVWTQGSFLGYYDALDI